MCGIVGIASVTNIKKVTSGSTPEIADLVDALYNEIITAGTHRAPSIKVAEAAKVIENTQRDINIALINELALIFNRMSLSMVTARPVATSALSTMLSKPTCWQPLQKTLWLRIRSTTWPWVNKLR